jgi:hypothetical protein
MLLRDFLSKNLSKFKGPKRIEGLSLEEYKSELLKLKEFKNVKELNILEIKEVDGVKNLDTVLFTTSFKFNEIVDLYAVKVTNSVTKPFEQLHGSYRKIYFKISPRSYSISEKAIRKNGEDKIYI